MRNRAEVWLLLWLLPLLVRIPAAEGQIPGCESSPMQRKTLQNETALCNDRTRAIYYLGSATSSRWMIFLEGGGVCPTLAQCKCRYVQERYQMSSNSSAYGETLCGTDVFDVSDVDNPFREFRHVMLPYCTQDLYIGGNAGEAAGSFDQRTAQECTGPTGPGGEDPGFVYAGSHVFTSMIMELKAVGLSAASEIILAGTSAGALGAMNHARWMQEQFPAATVRLLIDSGWIIDYKTIATRTLFTPYVQRNGQFQRRPACQEIYDGLPCCMSAVCMMERGDIGVPANMSVLIVTSSYDLFMLQLAIQESPGLSRGGFSNMLADYGGAINQTLNAVRSRTASASLIQTRCAQHTYLVSTTLWRSAQLRPAARRSLPLLGGQFNFTHVIAAGTWTSYRLQAAGALNGQTLRQLVGRWYNLTREGMVLRAKDSCEGFLCNSNCPDELTLKKEGTNLSQGAQIFILFFSVVLSVGAFLVKVGLKIHISLFHRSLRQFLDAPDKKLSDCLPESADVSVACFNLSYQLTIPVRVKPEEDPDISSRADEYSRIHENGALFTDSSPPSNGMKRSSSLPEDRPKLKIRNTRSLSLGGHNPASSVPQRPTTEVKVIINGVTAYFNSGSMVAIMGPSGCGKTTLMDLLTGRRAGDVNGEVLVNGHPLQSVHSWYHRNTGYVRQLATPYYDQLTVRENLLYSALLRLPSTHTRPELFEQMKMVIHEVGLSEIEERVVGGSTGGGISGGEKRRLCVAMQLMSMPNIVFLDEPTSGLDSTAAKELLNVLHIISQGNRLVVVSIHQPRPEIYHLFARIMFLCKGRVAFYGPPSKAVGFFMQAVQDRNPDSFDKLAADPEKSNPADLILDALNDERNQECILEHYDDSPEPKKILQAVKKAKRQAGTQSVFGLAHGRSLWRAFLCLEGRMDRQSWGQAMYLPLVFFCYGLGVGIAYYRASRGFLLLAAFNLLTNISFLFVSPALTSVLLGRCLHIFEMEHGDGVMRVSHLVLHTFVHMTAITLIPFIILTALIFYMVSIVGTFTDFLLILLLNLTANGTDIAIVILICVAVPDYATPIAHVVCAYVTFFEGFLYPVPDIHSAIRWLIYGNPNYYAFSAEMNILLAGRSLPCGQSSVLQCAQEDGNTILTTFGFDDADPYLYMLIMMLMTGFYLVLAMIALLPKGYVKTFFHIKFGHLFASKKNADDPEDNAGDDDGQNDTSPLLASDPDEHHVNIVHGPLLHTNSVWTSMKRQATQNVNLNCGPGQVMVPMAEPDPMRPRSKSASRVIGLAPRHKSSIAVLTGGGSHGSGEGRASAAALSPAGTSSHWSHLLKRRQSRQQAQLQATINEEKARPYAMRWRIKTQARKSGETPPESPVTALMVNSVLKWSRTVQEKQLEARREQSKRQISGHRKLMESSLDQLLNQVRHNRSDADAVADGSMSESHAAARGNWRNLTKRVKTANNSESAAGDGESAGDAADKRAGRRARHVHIDEMPHICEEAPPYSPLAADAVQSLDRSPRPRAQTNPLASYTPPSSSQSLPAVVSSAPSAGAGGSPRAMAPRSASGSSLMPSSTSPHSGSVSSDVSQSSTVTGASLPDGEGRRVPVPMLAEEPGNMRRMSYHQMMRDGRRRVHTHETAC